MKVNKIILIVAVMGSLTASKSYSQKGFAPDDKTNATVNTHYAKHLDFRESMLSQIRVPEGFKVSIAATGLGKPRIMAIAQDGSIYITRRDAGDVLLIADKDNDGRFETLKTVWSQFPDVHGITIHDGWLYLASSKILKRGKIMPGRVCLPIRLP